MQSLEHFKKVMEKIPLERLIPSFLLSELENCISCAIRQNEKYKAQCITVHCSEPCGFIKDFDDAFVRLVIAHDVFAGRLLGIDCLYPLDEAIFAHECGKKYTSVWEPPSSCWTRQYPI
jgi:hypothetical protein